MVFFKAYPFFFYSIYAFSRSKWGGSRDPAEIWAVSILCALEMFFLVSIEIELNKNGMPRISELPFFYGISRLFSPYWPLILIGVINFVFFFSDKRWARYIEEFDSYSDNKKLIGHLVSGLLVATLYFGQMVQILYFSTIN